MDDENLQKYLIDPHLTDLTLNSSNIHDTDFSILGSFPKLDTLSIGEAVIQKFESLKELEIQWLAIVLEMVVSIQNLHLT